MPNDRRRVHLRQHRLLRLFTSFARTNMPILRRIHQQREQQPYYWWMMIGGPDTLLPRCVESLLAWGLCLACLSVSGYHYCVDTYLKQPLLLLRMHRGVGGGGERKRIENGDHAGDNTQEKFPCWLPLMSFSRSELDRATPYERYEQFVQLLDVLLRQQREIEPQVPTTTLPPPSPSIPLDDDTLVEMIRTHEPLRRLASLAMRPAAPDQSNNNNSVAAVAVVHSTPIGQQLIRLWPRLLVLPPLRSPPPTASSTSSASANNNNNNNNHHYPYTVSLILPCYRESARNILEKLRHAWRNCADPLHVQVLVVLAGRGAKATFLEETTAATPATAAGRDDGDSPTALLSSLLRRQDYDYDEYEEDGADDFGQISVLEFPEESGRGPCLNFGARHAQGAIYAFCHSDTRLPPNWDAKLRNTFYPPMRPSENGDCSNNHAKKQAGEHDSYQQVQERRSNSCAFGFGIDTSTEGLQGGSLPPGIRAVEYTANLRCQWWSLPYGDQCLCLPASNFEYLGGFPHQCFMEDYDLIALLRKRAALLPQFFRPTTCHNDTQFYPGEKLTIVPGKPALCSPRRWQKFGVLYVTFMNSSLVGLYAVGNATPDEIYQRYYGRSLAVPAPKSPWEIQLEDLLS